MLVKGKLSPLAQRALNFSAGELFTCRQVNRLQ